MHALFLLLVSVTASTGEPNTCNVAPSCHGINEVRLARSSEWSCNAVTDHPELQFPKPCAPSNRFVPGVFTVRNESFAGHSRLALVPRFAYEDGKLRYEFGLSHITCDGGRIHATVDVINKQVRTPESESIEKVLMICALALLVAFALCICVCDSHSSSSSSDDFCFGMLLGSLLGGRESKVTFE
jgi:hypothetical protein